MDWLKRNYKTVIGGLVILILLEATVAWYLIGRFRESYLSGDEAFSAALSAAGVERADAGEPKIALRTRKGRAWYEVSFEAKTGEAYRCLIDAETGEALAAPPN